MAYHYHPATCPYCLETTTQRGCRATSCGFSETWKEPPLEEPYDFEICPNCGRVFFVDYGIDRRTY